MAIYLLSKNFNIKRYSCSWCREDWPGGVWAVVVLEGDVVAVGNVAVDEPLGPESWQPSERNDHSWHHTVTLVSWRCLRPSLSFHQRPSTACPSLHCTACWLLPVAKKLSSILTVIYFTIRFQNSHRIFILLAQTSDCFIARPYAFPTCSRILH